MERVKAVMRRIVFPGPAMTLLSIPAAAALLFIAFTILDETHPLTYLAYLFSAYSLIIVCTGAAPAVERIRQFSLKNRCLRRYLSDHSFKVWISLHCSLVVNLLYAGMNGLSGIWYHSVWFGTLSAYYLFLAFMRFLLLRYAHRHAFGSDLRREWQRYHICGLALVLMNLTLSAVVLLVLVQNERFQYAGSLIYAMALYTFFATIMAVVNIVRIRRYRSPALSAARAVNLAAALVSMLSLEIAMLAQFGGHEAENIRFSRIMTAASGAVIFVFIVGMGIYMIVHAGRQLRMAVNQKGRIDNESEQGNL
mgnify:CR=1 FL=1